MKSPTDKRRSHAVKSSWTSLGLAFGCAIGFVWEAGVLWKLIGGMGLSGVLIVAWFKWLAGNERPK